ncbi:MAG: type VI secretion system baseplate subunit TssK [Candidatus Desulfovibrio faecigallinarum]|nr:type VI secretion system baseplate subunit TssK [Candidatus Desulfovibrio faecigallinarum]
MTTEPRLFWEHGTLLQPQHFQLLEMSRATDCALLASLSSPYPWGVRELQIDEDALALGIVSLKALDVIFPDLTHAVLGQNALIAPQNCAEFWPNREEALMVCLGLPALSHASPNVTELARLEGEELARASTRFVASLDPEQRQDLLAGGAPADVRFMLLNLKLVFRQEDSERAPGGDLALLPLARLHSNAGTIVLDKGYVPPCLDIRASKILQEYVKGVRNTLASRLQQFEDYKLSARETSGRSGRLPLTIQSLALHTMLQVLARHLPLFEHVCETGFGHPWTVYAMMRSLVGELSLFSPNVNVLGKSRDGTNCLPAYDHLDPAGALGRAKALVSELAAHLATGPAHVLSFERKADFWTLFLPEYARSDYDFWLQVRSEDVSFLAGLASSGLRFASEDQIAALLSRSLPGVPLTEETQPQGLPRREDTRYLLLGTASPLWSAIQQGGKAALFLPNAPEDTRVHLVLMSPSARPGQ